MIISGDSGICWRQQKTPARIPGLRSELTSALVGMARLAVAGLRGPHFFFRVLSHDSASRASFFSLITGQRGDCSASSAVKSFHSSGKLSSWKIASTGHSGTHASQSMHSSGWM